MGADAHSPERDTHGAGLALRWPADRSLVLMYHRIGKVRRDSIVPGQYVSPGLLGRHIRLLQRLGFTGRRVKDGAGEQPTVHFTFDDAYRSVAEHALPLLDVLGWKSTIFVVSNEIGGTNSWDTQMGDVVEPLMTADELRRARDAGHELGAHSRTHPRLPQLQELDAEVRLNFEDLAVLTGEAPSVFCYPYGDEDERVRQAVREAGFALACSTRKGAWGPQTDPYLIPRLNMRSTTWTHRFFIRILKARR